MLSYTPVTKAALINQWVFWDKGIPDTILDTFLEKAQTLELKEGAVGDNKLNTDLRKSQVCFIYPIQEWEFIFNAIRPIIEHINAEWYDFILTGFGALQYTVYGLNEHYSWHSDIFLDGNGLAPYDIQPRKLSFVLALTDPLTYCGGELQLNNSTEEKAITIPMPKGRIVCFPSFLLHRVTPVTSGERRTLVGWVVGPKFR